MSKLCILAAYPYLNQRFVQSIGRHRDKVEVLVDSGAFTAWTKGTAITLDEYAGFLTDLPWRPDRSMTLDVIGDPDGTRRNFDELIRRGHAVTPIVTRGDDPSVLEHYYAHSDLIALGGVSAADRASAAWTRGMMHHVGKRDAHILGMTRLEWVKLLRPWSVDSSSWLSAARYGQVMVYLGHGRMEKFTPRDGKPSPRLAERIRRFGFDPYDCAKPSAGVGHNSLWQAISTTSWVEYALDQQAAIGTRLFLAMTTEHWFENLIRAYERVMAARAARS